MKHEFYRTQNETIDYLLNLNFIKPKDHILEPCCGDGAIIRRVKEYYPDTYIIGVEVDANHKEAISQLNVGFYIPANFHEMYYTLGAHFDKIIVNPPFGQTGKFIKHCHELLKPTGQMAFLLRMSLLSGIKNYRIFRDYPPTSVNIISKRPRFNGHVSDTCGYVWVIWDKELNPYSVTLDWIAPPGE